MISLSTREHGLWEGKDEKLEINKRENEIAETDKRKFEIVIGDNNLLPINFLKRGVEKSKSVALIKFPNNASGTGFLVSKDLLLTNHHVFPEAQQAEEAEIIFNFESDIYGNPEPADIYVCNPTDFFWSNENLDYALVKVNKRSNLNDVENVDYITKQLLPGERWGFIPLVSQTTIEINQRVNIIQHPEGRMKEIALHDNRITDINPERIIVKYTTDSEPGSSGSPGFTDEWKLVFLHHSAGDEDENGIFVNNEGILIPVIVNDLIKSLTDEKGKQILFELGIAGVKEYFTVPSLIPGSPEINRAEINRAEINNNFNYEFRLLIND
ncbi:trypsin-like serine peptidase [Bacillus pseudomycoides]|uniref:trypsin-like serine peptidase n=1 Tax=Bacillus pseudomycoides TaxID=64104 RepID=UPI003D652138